MANVLRDTIDQLYDGQRTGRYRWNELYKTEKTHCGTLVEINLQREFDFTDGLDLDYKIAGIEVDCKYSQTMGGWMIPPEAHGHICMVVWAEDSAVPKWSLGLVRIHPDLLNLGSNRDAKATLNKGGRDKIRWLFRNHPLPPNVLLQLDPEVVEGMMRMKSGAGRVRQIFRIAAGKIVGRAVIATVAQQKDYMKRVRANGGARTTLRTEGLLVLGQYSSHAKIAADLGISIPGPGDSISVRVVECEAAGHGVARIDGGCWRIANEGDQVQMAPLLPKPTKREVLEEERY